MSDDPHPTALEAYPQQNVFVTPLGLTMRVKLVPGAFLSYDVDVETMHKVVKRWMELYPQLGEASGQNTTP